jgi:hypothetical protein
LFYYRIQVDVALGIEEVLQKRCMAARDRR